MTYGATHYTTLVATFVGYCALYFVNSDSVSSMLILTGTWKLGKLGTGIIQLDQLQVTLLVMNALGYLKIFNKKSGVMPLKLLGKALISEFRRVSYCTPHQTLDSLKYAELRSNQNSLKRWILS